MTVSVAETPHQQWTGDGTATAFSVTAFDVLSFDFIEVYVWDLVATSVEPSRAHVDYAISGTLAAPVITFDVAPANTYIVTAFRNTAIIQRTDYRPKVPFLAETHERPFDKLTNIFAEMNFLIGRAFAVEAGLCSLVSNVPCRGKAFNHVFPAAITGPMASSEYPFSEVIWDEDGRQWIAKSGGRSGDAREFNGCALIDPWRVVQMFGLRISGASTVQYRFPPPGPCGAYACCFGAGGPAVPGSAPSDGAGGGGSTGGTTTDPTDPPAGTAFTIPGDPNWVPVRRCGDDTATGEYVEAGNITIVGTYFIRDGECLYLNPFDTAILNQATAPGTEIATVQTAIDNCADANCGISAGDCDAGPGKCTSVNWPAWVGGGAWCSDGPEPKRTYTIAGFSNTMFAMVGDCADPSTGCDAKTTDEWDGTFNAINGIPCNWEALIGGVNGEKSHNSKALGIATDVTFNSGAPSWSLTVSCFKSPSSGHDSWVGTKAYGRTPGGVYTRTSGSAGGCALTPATVTLT